MIVEECGTIAGGRCNGDVLWGWGIYQAKDKSGCAKGGNPGTVAISRIIEIIGKCASKCSLGTSVHTYNPSVSNRMPDNRAQGIGYGLIEDSIETNENKTIFKK
jgi:hypothetical protein